MKEELYKSVKSLHDCNVEKIEISQVAFSKDCPVCYPKDCFEIAVKIVKSEDIQSKNWIIFRFSDIEEFSIQKTPIWDWLIYDSDVIFEDGFYIFTIDNYIKIICSKIECFAESK